MRRRKLTRRPSTYTPHNTVELDTPLTESQVIRLISNPRNGFCSTTGEDKVLVSLDYSSQEILVATVLSKDPKMTEAQLAPKKFTREDGTEYVNPYADFHTLSACTCTHPHLIVGLPPDRWDEAVRTKEPSAKSKPRDISKTLNFAMLYLSTASSISERNHVKLSVAEQWVRNHRETYPGYYDWAEEYGNISAARGFALIPYTNYCRWCDQERSGGREGDSAVRASVNAAIQSLSSTQTKLSMIRIQQLIDSGGLPDTQIVGQCHDEVLMYCPGKSSIDWDKCKAKNGVFTELAFINNEATEDIAKRIQAIMENVQTEMFQALGSEIKGACSYSIAPVWAH